VIDSQLPLLPLVLDNVPPGLRQALAQEGVPAQPRLPGVPEGRFVLFDSQSGPCRWLGPDQVAIDVDRLRRAWKSDPFAALVDRRSRPHEWSVGGQVLREEIARVDKRLVRKRLLGQLCEEIERLGGVWLCVSAYPFPYRSALNFRIDYDEFQPAGFEATLRAVAGNEDCTTHFVCGSTFAPYGEALARLRGLDVGAHGYWHHTYRTAEENRRNIRRGIDTLRESGLEPSGFVAPHGRFHPALLTALEQLGITHSSEFGLAYDELPFFPENGHVLQIPIHPVCLELFIEAVKRAAPAATQGLPLDPAACQQAVANALDYFADTAQEKYRAGEPLFFYGHPTGPWSSDPHVLERLLSTAASFGALWRTTLTEFGAWWRVRGGVRLSVTRQGEELVVTTPNAPSDYQIGIEYHRGRHVARMPLAERVVRFSPVALAYETRAVQSGIRPVRIDGGHGLRDRFKRLIDWERVTPVAEIAPNNWRNWTKRALRRLTSGPR
jgi:hypothetical protein